MDSHSIMKRLKCTCLIDFLSSFNTLNLGTGFFDVFIGKRAMFIPCTTAVDLVAPEPTTKGNC